MLLQNCSFPRDDRVRREVRTLTAAGYPVAVIAPLASGQPRSEIVEGAHVYRFRGPSPGKHFHGYVWEYAYSMAAIFLISLRVLIAEGFDVVHGHHPPDTLALIGAFYRLLGKRYVLDHHDLAPELYFARFGGRGNRIVYAILVALEWLAGRVADRVIATNESYKIVEMRRGNVPEQSITIVRNGPDLKELGAVAHDTDWEHASKTTIGYVGVIGTQDGVDHLVRALDHLARDLGRDEFECIVVGSGEALPRVRSLAGELGIADRMRFVGWVDSPAQVGAYLKSMDICVAPEPSNAYNARSTAAKVMEYMAFGKPIVAFSLPEHRYSAQEAAVYAEPNDELDFARKIMLLMDDPHRRSDMGRRGRQRLEAVLDWSHQEVPLLHLYETLDQ
jgi:glycosyltransferase involved in cell wall biosynthesis